MDQVPEMRELQQNLAKVVSWKDLGLLLDVEYEELQKIEHKYRQDVEDCKKEMLNLWLKRRGKDATRRNIIEALKSINEYVVADHYTTLVKQRDASSNSQLNVKESYYTKAIEETKPQPERSAIVSAHSKTAGTTSSNKGRRRSSALSGRMGGVDDFISKVTISGALLFLVIALIIALGLYFYHGSSDMPSTEALTPITVENAETYLAEKMKEVTDLYKLAACLNLKNSKALVDQHLKNSNGRVEHVRIEVMDTWLKSAEHRYWEELIEVLHNCVRNKRLAKAIQDEHVN